MNTPAKMIDLSKIDTGLSADEKAAARIEGLRQKALTALGSRWVLSPLYAPPKGTYNPMTGARLA